MNQVPASDPLSSWQVRLKGQVAEGVDGPLDRPMPATTSS
jgi:hypothetical protein